MKHIYVGRYSKGYKNDNGNYLSLIDFCQNNELLVLTNTCFKHKLPHLTTW